MKKIEESAHGNALNARLLFEFPLGTCFIRFSIKNNASEGNIVIPGIDIFGLGSLMKEQITL
jgi:hypothetical protein